MAKQIDYLENWVVLNKHVQKLDEDTLRKLIDKEKKGHNRPQFLVRLHGRYNRLRAQREKKEILSYEKK